MLISPRINLMLISRRALAVVFPVVVIFFLANSIFAKTNILVTNLSPKTTSETLFNTFVEFGEIESAKVITDMKTGKSKGYGFVVMPNDEEAMHAVGQLDGTVLDGNVLSVRKSDLRESTPSGSGGFGTSRPGNQSQMSAQPGKPATEKLLDVDAVEALLAEATDWLSDLIEDDEVAETIAQKWENLEGLAGKTRSQILNLLRADAANVIKDQATRNRFIRDWNARVARGAQQSHKP